MLRLFYRAVYTPAHQACIKLDGDGSLHLGLSVPLSLREFNFGELYAEDQRAFFSPSASKFTAHPGFH